MLHTLNPDLYADFQSHYPTGATPAYQIASTPVEHSLVNFPSLSDLSSGTTTGPNCAAQLHPLLPLYNFQKNLLVRPGGVDLQTFHSQFALRTQCLQNFLQKLLPLFLKYDFKPFVPALAYYTSADHLEQAAFFTHWLHTPSNALVTTYIRPHYHDYRNQFALRLHLPNRATVRYLGPLPLDQELINSTIFYDLIDELTDWCILQLRC